MGLLKKWTGKAKSAARDVGERVRAAKDYYSPSRLAKLSGVPASYIKKELDSGKISSETVRGKRVIRKEVGDVIIPNLQKRYARSIGGSVAEVRKRSLAGKRAAVKKRFKNLTKGGSKSSGRSKSRDAFSLGSSSRSRKKTKIDWF